MWANSNIHVLSGVGEGSEEVGSSMHHSDSNNKTRKEQRRFSLVKRLHVNIWIRLRALRPARVHVIWLKLNWLVLTRPRDEHANFTRLIEHLVQSKYREHFVESMYISVEWTFFFCACTYLTPPFFSAPCRCVAPGVFSQKRVKDTAWGTVCNTQRDCMGWSDNIQRWTRHPKAITNLCDHHTVEWKGHPQTEIEWGIAFTPSHDEKL